MKTMEKLCRRFERMFPDWCAELDTLESYPGCYRICIINTALDVWAWHMFTSCRDFCEWMHGVVLD